MATGDRLQKVLARAGLASRRHAEEMIAAGRVRVNGRIVTELGTRVVPHRDRVELDGRAITAEPLVYYLFHKPRGTVTTLSDPEGRATIAEYLNELPARVFPVGRLDFHTSGALLLTNDGELAQALLHPRRAVPKTYVAKVRGVPTDLQLEPWRTGMEVPPVGDEPGPLRLAPVDVEVLRHSPSGEEARHEEGTTWMKITLREGRNRQIHRMAEAVGLYVMRLARIAFAGLTTDTLRPGELRPLTERELTYLRATFLRPVEQAAQRAARGGGSEERAGDASAERKAGPRAERASGARGGGARAEARPTRGPERGGAAATRGRRERGADARAPQGARGGADARGTQGARGAPPAHAATIDEARRGARTDDAAHCPKRGGSPGRGPRGPSATRAGDRPAPPRDRRR